MKNKINCETINLLCIVVLIGTAVWLHEIWSEIPQDVPVLFSIFGKVVKIGIKRHIMVVATFNWMIYAIFIFIEEVNGAWAPSIRVTSKNLEKAYLVIRKMLALMKLLLVLTFTIIIIFMVIGKNIPFWFLPLVLAGVLGLIIWCIVTVRKYR